MKNTNETLEKDSVPICVHRALYNKVTTWTVHKENRCRARPTPLLYAIGMPAHIISHVKDTMVASFYFDILVLVG